MNDSTEPGAELEEEPQEERGDPGSRDAGDDDAGGGPADRPAGTAEIGSDSGVDPQAPIDPDSPHLITP